MRAVGLLALFLGLFAHNSLSAQPVDDTVPSSERAYNYALAVVLNGDQTEIVDKRIGPIRAIATSHDESSRDLVNKAVGDVNDAFGYGKVALSWSDHASIEDDAITIYIGPKRIGRQLIERFGVSSPRAFGSSTYYY